LLFAFRYTDSIKLIALTLSALILIGCTTTSSQDPSPEQIQKDIRDGTLAQPGQWVTIVTTKGARQNVKVLAVTATTVSCGVIILEDDGSVDEDTFENNQVRTERHMSILIDDIIAVEKYHSSESAEAVMGAVAAPVGAFILVWLYIVLPAALVAFLM
jgi:hypothetical protein